MMVVPSVTGILATYQTGGVYDILTDEGQAVTVQIASDYAWFHITYCEVAAG